MPGETEGGGGGQARLESSHEWDRAGTVTQRPSVEKCADTYQNMSKGKEGLRAKNAKAT